MASRPGRKTEKSGLIFDRIIRILLSSYIIRMDLLPVESSALAILYEVDDFQPALLWAPNLLAFLSCDIAFERFCFSPKIPAASSDRAMTTPLTRNARWRSTRYLELAVVLVGTLTFAALSARQPLAPTLKAQDEKISKIPKMENRRIQKPYAKAIFSKEKMWDEVGILSHAHAKCTIEQRAKQSCEATSTAS
eukprot:jgi/Bigna1/81664/fgenesh1_pg.82_\